MLSDSERAALRERVGTEVIEAVVALSEEAARGGVESRGFRMRVVMERPRSTSERNMAFNARVDALLLAIDRLREGGNG